MEYPVAGTVQTKHGQHQSLKAFLEAHGCTVYLVVVPNAYTGRLLQSLTTVLKEIQESVGVTDVQRTKPRLITHSLAYTKKTPHDNNLAAETLAPNTTQLASSAAGGNEPSTFRL